MENEEKGQRIKKVEIGKKKRRIWTQRRRRQ